MSPDNHHIAAATVDGAIFLDTHGKPRILPPPVMTLKTKAAGKLSPRSVAFSPDGAWVVAAAFFSLHNVTRFTHLIVAWRVDGGAEPIVFLANRDYDRIRFGEWLDGELTVFTGFVDREEIPVEMAENHGIAVDHLGRERWHSPLTQVDIGQHRLVLDEEG